MIHFVLFHRLLRSVPSSIEVYPGDDSVLRSTGMTAVFFQHFLHRNDKVGESGVVYFIGFLSPLCWDKVFFQVQLCIKTLV